MLTVIPEKILLESLRTAFAYLRKDFSLHADESNTLLYKILQGNSIDRYELFKQAKAVFLAPQDNPRHLDIRLYFNSERAPLPTIHITLPSENTINNTLGIGEGLRDNEFITDENDSYRRTFNRRFIAKYNLIVTSDNTNEVVLIYHLTRSILISLIEYFAQRGLDSIKIGGSDLNIKNDLVPVNIHFRAISIEFQYDVGAIDFIKTDVISSLDFNAIMIDTLSDPYYCGEVSQFSVSANPATSSNECCDCTGLSEYLQTNTYQVGVAAIHNKNIYQSTSVTTGPFDSTKWVNLFEDLFNKNNDTTDDILNEGTTNLWYTNTRVDVRIELKSGVVGGFAPLDSNLKIPNSYLYSSGGGGTVTSVNGDSGPVVVLDTDDIDEGSINFYYTDLRADNRIDAQKGVANGIADLDSNTKLSLSYLTLTDSYIYVGNASNVPVGVSLSGDATLSNLGALTLSTVNSNIGTFGSATQVPQFTVNGKGLITAVSNITIAPAASSITGGQALTKVDDTNVTLTLGGTPNTALLQSTSLTLGWTGTLSSTRLNSNVVQSITNDTNVTGSILSQNLTLGWTGQLSVSRGGTGLSTFGGTNTLLYTTTANNISSISTSNTSTLITNSSGVPSWTSGSTANRVLRTDGTSITFSQVSLTTDISGILPIANGGTNKSSYTSGSVIYYDGTSLTENNSQLFWDNSNNRLGIGINTSLGARLHISQNTGTGTNKILKVDGNATSFFINENGDGEINLLTIGRGKGQEITNSAYGIGSVFTNISGTKNSGFGYITLYLNQSGNSNTAIGYSALFGLISGSRNTAIGSQSMQSLQVGIDNVAVGEMALANAINASFNVAVGNSALQSNISGITNIAVGGFSLNKNISGNGNTGFGDNSLYNTLGNYNTGTGQAAGYDITSGNNNTIVGQNTGRGITTGSYNTIIGAGVSGLSTTLSNTIILADGTGTIRLYTDSSGKTGIGTTSPKSTLDVSGSIGVVTRRVATGETMSTSYTTYVLTDSAASDQTFTCPTIASSTNRIYFLKNQSQTYNMTIDGDGSEEFIPLGAVPVTSFDLAPGEACMIQNDGTYWNIL